MQYEVEQKHRIHGDDAGLLQRLGGMGATPGEPVGQTDQYFAHPCRDFAQTDEALRVRTEGERSFVTYKGPKLDAKTKTRLELELPLDATDAGGKRLIELLEALGFTKVAVVEKTRRPFQIQYAGRTIEGAYDLVHQVGSFIELEFRCGPDELEETRRIIAELAAKLELGPSITRSYLEMLLEKGEANT